MSSRFSAVVGLPRALMLGNVKPRKARICVGVVPLGLLCVWLLLVASAARADEFYVVRHHWHSGIVVARADIPPGAWPQEVTRRDFARCRYLEVGWGDRKFYTAPKPTAAMALGAALIPGPSVLHVAGFVASPSKTHQWTEIIEVSCTHGEFVELCAAIGRSFACGASDQPVKLGPGLYGFQSQFYAARDRYWIGNNCNSWTLRQARQGGLPTRLGVAGTLSSKAVTDQVKRLLARRDCAGGQQMTNTKLPR